MLPMLPQRPSYRSQNASFRGWNSPASSALACCALKHVARVVGLHGLYSPRLTNPPCGLGATMGIVRSPLATTLPSDQVFHTMPPDGED